MHECEATPAAPFEIDNKLRRETIAGHAWDGREPIDPGADVGRRANHSNELGAQRGISVELTRTSLIAQRDEGANHRAGVGNRCGDGGFR